MTRGKVRHICVSLHRGTVKREVPQAMLQEAYGLVGDAHAGDWHRQVSLLDAADIAAIQAKGLPLHPGDFGENLVVEGLALSDLRVGARLQVGDAVLEITQIGKECHHRCQVYQRAGDCIMPRLGVFARVIQGGEIGLGTPIEVRRDAPAPGGPSQTDSA
jgi:MOSC domain-containing protein YiiM